MAYTRFIILGQQRTGSVLLQQLLDSHPNIICAGEAFNPSFSVRKNIARLERPVEKEADPIAYLNEVVFKTYPSDIKAVGFRLFYDHAQDEKWQGVWEYLRQMEIKVIHLRRNNSLDRYLSLQLACRSNIWVKIKETVDNHNAPISLDPKACFQDIYRSQVEEEERGEFFASLSQLDVTYEALTRPKDQIQQKILDFLDVPMHELKTVIKKQRVRSKPDVIKNYAELREYLITHLNEPWIQKKWLTFFDDE